MKTLLISLALLACLFTSAFAQVPGCMPNAKKYCGAAGNSTGLPAKIDWSGSVNIQNNSFSLHCRQLPANVPAIAFYGTGRAGVLACDGGLCIQTIIKRTNVTFSDAGGFATVSANPVPMGISAEKANFQFWYRDVAAGLTGCNFSQALEVNFCDTNA